MNDLDKQVLTLIVIENVKIDLNLVEKSKSIFFRVIPCKIEDFCHLIRERLGSIVLLSFEILQKIVPQLSDPESLSKEYLHELIVLGEELTNCKNYLRVFPYTNFYFIPDTDDEITNSNLLISLLEKFQNAKLKKIYEDNVIKLEQKLMDLSIDNKNRISQVEKYISELEMKTLEYELLTTKLEKEIQLRKSYEGELSKLNNTLQEYSLKLNEMIKELNTFNYTISHDLKAPLRGIIGYIREIKTEHLNQLNLNERALYCIEQINKLAENMSLLIDDLLQYSKIGFETPTLVKCSLEEIINSILDDLSKDIYERKAKIELNLEFKEFFSWPRGLSQILSNLIGNALKYSKQGVTPVISISSKQKDKNVIITVEDNGIGFDMVFAERIFQLFKRAMQDPNIQGTGVGLAIVSKIVEKLKGKVWAESQVGVGSKFFVQLPITEGIENVGGNQISN